MGILLVLLGVLCGLGIYADAAGPVGEVLNAASLGLLGLVGNAVPPLLVWLGLALAIGRPSESVGRVVAGATLLLLGVLVALHLGVDQPHPSDGLTGLWRAGGLVGWAVGSPLVWALSLWGAIAVVVALLALGAVFATGFTFADVFGAFRRVLTERPADASGAPTEDPQALRPTQLVEPAGPAPDAASSRAILAAVDDEPAAEPTVELEEPAEEFAGGAVMPEPAVDDRPRRAARVSPVRSWADYELPSLDLLARGRATGNESDRTIRAQVDALQATFQQFGVDATVARWSRGPTVTRFEIELGPGVQVKKVANMGDDIAYALAAPDVRIVAPIPGKSAIGVEVPNRKRDLITLGDILRSDDALADPHPLTVALGVDIAGRPSLVNLTTMPHLLVSGATGSGKSVTLNGMISSVIMRARPDQVRMILIDPKRVELNAYEGAPHLLSPVVTDPRRAADAVQWCVKEMEQRYELLALAGFRNLDGYNEAVREGRLESRPGPDGTEIEPTELPYVLLVIDELADLMLVAPRDVEDAICRIAQMARAVGIHMIIATQRPSVDVITGLIKANIPSRLALAVASQTDSRTILDANGAEKLVGKGDMLFLPASQGKPSRLQGCWITETEVANIVSYCRAQRRAEFDESVLRTGEDAQRADAQRSGDDTSDEALLRRAADQVVTSGLGSTSMLQRKLRIGFARAGRLMDELEVLGVVGPNEGSKAREVHWDAQQLEDATASGAL
ncbi:MAG: DNA translocase FtsK 4TM domain-containing protein [Nitriliruptoraceae bacterium]